MKKLLTLRKSKYYNWLRSFIHIFAFDKDYLDVINLVKFDIDTGDAFPIKKPPYRVAQLEEQTLWTNVEKLVKDDMIEPSKSAWAFSLFLVKKKTGELRPVVKYQSLNEVTQTELYPLLMIDHCFDALGGMKYFSVMDCKSRYNQIAMDEDSKEKTAFWAPQGLF